MIWAFQSQKAKELFKMQVPWNEFQQTIANYLIDWMSDNFTSSTQVLQGAIIFRCGTTNRHSFLLKQSMRGWMGVSASC